MLVKGYHTMILTRSTEYAIGLLLHLHDKDGSNYYSLNKIADETDLPFHYLSKISRKLTENGILSSSRGPNGGVALAVPPEKITLFDIVSIIEGNEIFTECLIRFSNCSSANPCQIHAKWYPVHSQIVEFFEETTIDQIMGHHEVQEKGAIYENSKK